MPRYSQGRSRHNRTRTMVLAAILLLAPAAAKATVPSLVQVYPPARHCLPGIEKSDDQADAIGFQVEMSLRNLVSEQLRVILGDPDREVAEYIRAALILERAHARRPNLVSQRRLLIAYYRCFDLLHTFHSPAEQKRLIERGRSMERSARRMSGSKADSNKGVVATIQKFLSAFSRSKFYGPRAYKALVPRLIDPLGMRLLQNAPGNVETRILVGQANSSVGRYDRALEVLRKAQHLDKSGNVMAALGKALFLAGKREDAESYFDMARVQNPAMAPAIEAFRRRSQAEDGVTRYGKLIRKDPKSMENLLGLARSRADLGQIPKALKILKTCIQAHPKRTEPVDYLLKLGLTMSDPTPVLRYITTHKPPAMSKSRTLNGKWYLLVLRHVARKAEQGDDTAARTWAQQLNRLPKKFLGRSYLRRAEANIIASVLAYLCSRNEKDASQSSRNQQLSGKSRRLLSTINARARRYATDADMNTEPAQRLKAVLLLLGSIPRLGASIDMLRKIAEYDQRARFAQNQLLLLRALLRGDKKTLENVDWAIGRLKPGTVASEWEIAMLKAKILLVRSLIEPKEKASALKKASKVLAKLLLWRSRIGLPPHTVRLIRANLAYCYLEMGDHQSSTRTLDSEKIAAEPNRIIRNAMARTLARAFEKKGDKSKAARIKAMITPVAPGDRTGDGLLIHLAGEKYRFPLFSGDRPKDWWINSGLAGGRKAPMTVKARMRARSVWFNVIPMLTITQPRRGRRPFLAGSLDVPIVLQPPSMQ